MKYFVLYEGKKVPFPTKEEAKAFKDSIAIMVEAEDPYRCENGLCTRTMGKFIAERSIAAHGMVLCGKCCRELFPLPVEDDGLSPCIL